MKLKVLLFVSVLMSTCVAAFFWIPPSHPALACPGSNQCLLDVPGTVEANGLEFNYTLYASWATTGTPFLGAVTAGASTDGIENVTFTPSYFFPSACENQEVEIDVDGDVVESHPAPVINNRLQVGPTPYNCETFKPTAIEV